MKNKEISKRELFSSRYSPIYSPILGEDWLEKAEAADTSAFRINTKLSTIKTFLSTYDRGFSNEVKQISDTTIFITNRDKSTVTNSSEYKQQDGLFLNPSSLIPPLLIGIKDNSHIIELCSAPGVKSSQVLFRSQESNTQIHLTMVEKDLNRFRNMRQLLNNFFSDNKEIETVNIDARKLNNNTLYDSVLADVPCSAEGEMIRDKNYKLWSSKLINSYTNTQKSLLAKAISLAKPGGEIIYSTCTLAPEENEEIVNWALKRFDIQIDDIDIPSWGISTPKVVPGIPTWGIKQYDTSISKTIRIAPTNTFEGFYVAKIRKGS